MNVFLWEAAPAAEWRCLAAHAFASRGSLLQGALVQASAFFNQSAKVAHSQRSMVPVRQHR